MSLEKGTLKFKANVSDMAHFLALGSGAFEFIAILEIRKIRNRGFDFRTYTTRPVQACFLTVGFVGLDLLS